jgi:hypothetical protein
LINSLITFIEDSSICKSFNVVKCLKSVEYRQYFSNKDTQLEFLKDRYPDFIDSLKEPFLEAREQLQSRVDKHIEHLTQLRYGDLALDESSKVKIEFSLKNITDRSKNAIGNINNILTSFSKHLQSIKILIEPL